MSAQAKGLAALLAAHGRKGDTELMHVTKNEVAALNRLKRGIDGRDLPRNPTTGLREANFFNQYIVPVLPAVAGLAAGAMTGGTMAAPAAALAGAATGAGTKAIQGGSSQDILMGGGLGAISGYGAGTLGAGLAGADTAATTAATGTTPTITAPVEEFAMFGGDVAAPTANAFTATPTATVPTATAPATTAPTTNAFTEGVQQGSNLYAGASDTSMFGNQAMAQSQAEAGKTLAGAPAATSTAPAPQSQGINWNYLGTKEASSAAGPMALGTLGATTLGPYDTTSTDTETTDGTLPKAEVYYTPTGERRTRIVDRPQYGNVNMARGGDVYGDYDGVDEAPDGGYHPGGGLNNANGGIASFGWGGFVESMQPGGAWGNATADLYGVVDKNVPFLKDITPGGAVGQLQPGRRDWERKQAEEAQRKKDEEAAGIAAAAKAKEKAAFEQQWSDRYGAPVTMAEGGLSSLGHYSDGGQMLRGPGDGVSDSIPASIDGKRPARLADGEFVIPARAVSELGNGSTEAGSKQLYAMLDRIAKKRKTGKGLAYQANPKKMLPV